MICYWGTNCTPLYKSLFQRYKFLKAIHNIDDKFKEYQRLLFEKNHFFSCVAIDKCLSLHRQVKTERTLKTNELIKKLKAAGCWFLESGTNHDWWWSPISEQRFQVPRHATQDIGWNLLKSIEKQSGVKF